MEGGDKKVKLYIIIEFVHKNFFKNYTTQDESLLVFQHMFVYKTFRNDEI